jgi:hypothetical protein
MDEAIKKTRLKNAEALALVIKSWRHHALGEKPAFLRYNPDEDYPSLSLNGAKAKTKAAAKA